MKVLQLGSKSPDKDKEKVPMGIVENMCRLVEFKVALDQKVAKFYATQGKNNLSYFLEHESSEGKKIGK